MADKGLTDFNDLYLEKGLQAVKAQIEAAIIRGKVTVELENSASLIDSYASYPEFYDYGEYEIPLPMNDVSTEDTMEDMGRYSNQTLLEQFWFVWGSDTCWDNIHRRQMRLSHLRHGVGKERYKAWDQSMLRKCVKEIVFEPGRQMGRHVVNLYDGIKMQPDQRGATGCARILDHIFRLCGYREDEFNWLIRWIAYPLQNPGAKMASSVIMYGSEGPGKSVLWEEIVKKIYGEYAVTIGQAQLESQFTGWRSKRLFALAEEVVSRSERNHHKGVLKQLVTGTTSMINEKMLPEREETNHMNFVFLSNSMVPLELDMGDRRYLVLYIDKKPSKDYFRQLFDEINNGGVECFYQYLLNLNMGDFTAHTEPPVNAEKEELIGASLPSPVYFHRLWKAGELDIPYMSAVSGDLFRFFQRWCEQANEFKRTERYFGTELKRVMRQVRTSIKYPTDISSAITKRIYVARDEEEAILPGQLAEECRKFKRMLERAEKD